MNYGVDISTFNKSIEYNKMKENIKFAIIRAGFGVSYLPEKQKDVMFETHYTGCKNAGILVGAYYYQYANEIGEGKKEAENCLKYIEGKSFDLPIFYDVEDGSINGLSKEKLTAIVKEFCQTIESAGYKAGVYANKSWLTNKLDVEELKEYAIWCAVYGKNDGNIPEDSVKYTGKHEIWQYTSRGYVEGINGRVDMNIMYDENTIEESQGTTPKEPEKVFTGDETIRKIQETLNQRYNVGLDEDGYYGPKTKEGLVKGLQTELNNQYGKGLNIDGIFGAKTKAACINVRQGAKGNITYLIQAMLYCKGYNTNGVEGIFGNGTASAVRKFQGDIGISVDGVVGKNTFEKLFK